MAKLYKIDAQEISKLVTESKQPRAKKPRLSKKIKLVNSELPPKEVPKVEKIPLIRTDAEVSMPSPKPTESVSSESIPEPTPEPVIEPEPIPEPIPTRETDTSMEVDEEPPQWFTKFCLQVKEEQEKQAREAGERKVPQRVIKEDAEQYAHERWQDPKVREKVESKINNNLKSIYSMVFPNRNY